MDMMRMDSSGKNLACRSCLERKPAQKQPIQETNPTIQAKEGPVKEYFCRECKYGFKRAKHLAISTCPYCDSKSLMVKGSTARIIADASRMKGD